MSSAIPTQQQQHHPVSPAAAAAAATTTTAVSPQQQQQQRRVKASTSSAARAAATAGRSRRRMFSLGNMRFRISSRARLMDTIMDTVSWFVEGLVYVIGPLLILLALGIIGLLTYCFITILVPMMMLKHNNDDGYYSSAYLIVGVHCVWVLFLVSNILYNYFYCVCTRNYGKHYDDVVQDMADASGFHLPITPQEITSWKREYEDKMVLRMRRRRAREQERIQQQQQQQQSQQQQQASSNTTTGGGMTHRGRYATSTTGGATTNTTATTNGVSSSSNSPTSQQQSQQQPQPPPQQLRSWMLMSPFEWGYDHNSNLPKPPRSHYDHVTKQLVLNLDHYCPWMFNSIGYFNYRYFCNFLLYIFIGMVYGAIVCLEPFLLLGSVDYQKQWGEQQHMAQQQGIKHVKDYAKLNVHRLQPMLPFRQERMLITLSFMLCVAVGFAVMLLGGFHLYLVLTAQTTIEFHANVSHKRRAKASGIKWKNPYDQGWKRNWHHVYGQCDHGLRHWLVALLPSSRQPDSLPAPIPGHSGLRQRHSKRETDENGDVLLQEVPLLREEPKGEDLA